MPTGEKFAGAGELKKILLNRSDLFVGAYAEKLMNYAIGRGTEYYDQPALRQILREAKPDGYKWNALVMGVIRSAPFTSRVVR